MTSTPATAELCPGCFADKGLVKVCPHCGYDESLKRGPLVLPHRTLLHQGQYLVGKVLGKPGGFGITYLALDTKLETRVAIKEYLPRDLAGRDGDHATVSAHSSEDGEHFRYGLTQFLQEARTLARFDHANIVRVRNFFEENSTGYLVMDYYDGITLADYLTQQPQGKLPEKTAVDILMPILDGLREVHAKNFLHRDIKPQNIYLTTGNRAILLDFGAARQAMSERSRSVSVVLSEGYAPYEQYHRRGEQGPWTDIYASAAVLYHAVAGQAPPPATERMSKDELDVAGLGLSESLTNAIQLGMATDHKNRPQRMTEFQALLLGGEELPGMEEVAQPEKTTPTPPIQVVTPQLVDPSRSKITTGKKVFMVLLTATVVIVIALVVMAIDKEKKAAPTSVASVPLTPQDTVEPNKVPNLSAPDEYAKYENSRFGFTISYPSRLLTPQGEAENGDGQRFISQDKKTELIAYGSNTESGWTLKDDFERELKAKPNSQITYKVLRNSWYVISGTDGNLIFYIKTVQAHNSYVTFNFSYPMEGRGAWDKVLVEITNGFKRINSQ